LCFALISDSRDDDDGFSGLRGREGLQKVSGLGRSRWGMTMVQEMV